MIIGISGKAQSGKDTLCSYLQSEFASNGRKARRLAFADELKRVIGKELFDLSYEQMYTSEGKEAIDPRYQLAPRSILQEAGTLMREVYSDVWVDLVLRQTDDSGVFIIPDVRFENEWASIQGVGGWCVRLERPSIRIGIGAEHPSETGLDHVPQRAWDFWYKNEGSLEDLQAFGRTIAAEAR